MGNCFSTTTKEVTPPGITIQPVTPTVTTNLTNSCTEQFKEILVVTSPGGPVALTFDDNRFNNRWSYHGGGNNVHVTELFKVCPLGGGSNKVKIFAVGPPLPFSPLIKWQLTVSEQNGAPNQYPEFIAVGPGTLIANSSLTTEFERDDSGLLTAFSFVSSTTGERFYLVPSTTVGVQHIEILQTNDPQFVFAIPDIANLASFSVANVFTARIVQRREFELQIISCE